MRESYNELLRLNLAGKPIDFTVNNVRYGGTKKRSHPIKYTGDKRLPIFPATSDRPRASDFARGQLPRIAWSKGKDDK